MSQGRRKHSPLQTALPGLGSVVWEGVKGRCRSVLVAPSPIYSLNLRVASQTSVGYF